MRIVDLFSGSGGLTFGFYYSLVNGQFVQNENCDIVFANEFDKKAAEAFHLNYPDIEMLNCDIRSLTEQQILNLINNNPIDLIIGGPPCQSFSTIGKRIYDDKARLYNEYIRMLQIVQPRMFVFENVKGILSMKNEFGNLVIEDIVARFQNIQDGLGYQVQYQILDAVNFGVPQHRERVFIIGIRKDQNINWEFPIGNPNNHLTIQEAISDLPELAAGEEAIQYANLPNNPYQTLMRGNNNHLTLHKASTHGEKIQTVLDNVIQGEGKDYFNNLIEQGLINRRYYLTSGYKNTYGRLVANQPCTTITNNMSTPSGLRCIHYEQNRPLTPREGARIQSFPDWFNFVGGKIQVTTQIGNAVPPLLAMALARQIENALNGDI